MATIENQRVDRELREAWREAGQVLKAVRRVNRMPETRALREAALAFAKACAGKPADPDDTLTRDANAVLLNAAVAFVRALRGERVK